MRSQWYDIVTDNISFVFMLRGRNFTGFSDAKQNTHQGAPTLGRLFTKVNLSISETGFGCRGIEGSPSEELSRVPSVLGPVMVFNKESAERASRSRTVAYFPDLRPMPTIRGKCALPQTISGEECKSRFYRAPFNVSSKIEEFQEFGNREVTDTELLAYTRGFSNAYIKALFESSVRTMVRESRLVTEKSINSIQEYIEFISNTRWLIPNMCAEANDGCLCIEDGGIIDRVDKYVPRGTKWDQVLISESLAKTMGRKLSSKDIGVVRNFSEAVGVPEERKISNVAIIPTYHQRKDTTSVMNPSRQITQFFLHEPHSTFDDPSDYLTKNLTVHTATRNGWTPITPKKTLFSSGRFDATNNQLVPLVKSPSDDAILPEDYTLYGESKNWKGSDPFCFTHAHEDNALLPKIQHPTVTFAGQVNGVEHVLDSVLAAFKNQVEKDDEEHRGQADRPVTAGRDAILAKWFKDGMADDVFTAYKQELEARSEYIATYRPIGAGVGSNNENEANTFFESIVTDIRTTLGPEGFSSDLDEESNMRKATKRFEEALLDLVDETSRNLFRDNPEDILKEMWRVKVLAHNTLRVALARPTMGTLAAMTRYMSGEAEIDDPDNEGERLYTKDSFRNIMLYKRLGDELEESNIFERTDLPPPELQWSATRGRGQKSFAYVRKAYHESGAELRLLLADVDDVVISRVRNEGDIVHNMEEDYLLIKRLHDVCLAKTATARAALMVEPEVAVDGDEGERNAAVALNLRIVAQNLAIQQELIETIETGITNANNLEGPISITPEKFQSNLRLLLAHGVEIVTPDNGDPKTVRLLQHARTPARNGGGALAELVNNRYPRIAEDGMVDLPAMGRLGLIQELLHTYHESGNSTDDLVKLMYCLKPVYRKSDWSSFFDNDIPLPAVCGFIRFYSQITSRVLLREVDTFKTGTSAYSMSGATVDPQCRTVTNTLNFTVYNIATGCPSTLEIPEAGILKTVSGFTLVYEKNPGRGKASFDMNKPKKNDPNIVSFVTTYNKNTSLAMGGFSLLGSPNINGRPVSTYEQVAGARVQQRLPSLDGGYFLRQVLGTNSVEFTTVDPNALRRMREISIGLNGENNLEEGVDYKLDKKGYVVWLTAADSFPPRSLFATRGPTMHRNPINGKLSLFTQHGKENAFFAGDVNCWKRIMKI